MKPIKFVNCTGRKIILNDGQIFEPSSKVVKVSNSVSEFDSDHIATIVYGNKIDNLPEPKKDTMYIVPLSVLMKSDRVDLIAPAYEHNDCILNTEGQIVSVPGFIMNLNFDK